MTILTISLLGPVVGTINGRSLVLSSSRAQALLAYLVMNREYPQQREALMELLWPGMTPQSAQVNLRRALYLLRQALTAADESIADHFFLSDRHAIQLNPEADVALDVHRFCSLLRGSPSQEQLEDAVALYRGDFLSDFYLPDSAPFEEWTAAQRADLRRQAIEAYDNLVHQLISQKAYEAAQTYAQQQLILDSLHERGHRHLMEILVRRGQRSAALAQFDVCRRQLNQELGVEPEAETVRLYEELKHGRFMPISPTPIPTWPGLIPQAPAEPVRFVARDAEMESLNAALKRAAAGQGGIYFVTGEPGSGKTALLAEFTRHALAQDADLLAVWGQCSAFTGQGDPYFPFLNVIRMLVGEAEAPVTAGVGSDQLMARLWQQLPATVDAVLDQGQELIGRFFSGQTLLRFARQHSGVAPDRLKQLETLLPLLAARSPQQQSPQAALFEQFSQVLHALAQSKPLLLIVDDLHWIDSGSVSLLFHLGLRLAHSRILLIGAYRPEETTQPRGGEAHPLPDVVGELQRTYGDVHIDLMRGSVSDFVDALLDSEPNHLSREFRTLLQRRTSGNPLFTTELLRGMQLRGEIQRDSQGYWVEGPNLNWRELPARIEAVIARHISHLSPPCRDALRVASVEGEQFTADVVAAVLQEETAQVCRLLSQEACRQHRLVAAQSIRPVNEENLAIYHFRHGLFQIYLYNQLDVVEKAHLHGLVGSKLEALYQPNLARFPEMAHALARHFAVAHIVDKAVLYYTMAGKNAQRLSANQEAIAHFYSALELLPALPATPERDSQELDLQLSLGPALTAVKGWAPPEMAVAYARAQELCANIDDSTQLVPALWLLATFRLGRSEHAEVDKLCARLLRLAQQAGDPDLLALARLQASPFYQGQFILARQRLEEACAAPDEAQQRRLAQQFGMAPAVVALAYLAECLWILGFPEEADQRGREARKLAEQIQHPLTTCYALGRFCWLAATKGDVEAAGDFASRWRRVAEQYGLEVFALAAQFSEDWAAVLQGDPSVACIAQMQQAMDAYRATGTLLNRTTFLVFFAQACAVAGEIARGLAAVDESLALGEQTGELWFQSQAYRIKGKLLQMEARNQAQPAAILQDAATCFVLARQTAEQQGAVALAQRASADLNVRIGERP